MSGQADSSKTQTLKTWVIFFQIYHASVMFCFMTCKFFSGLTGGKLESLSCEKVWKHVIMFTNENTWSEIGVDVPVGRIL